MSWPALRKRTVSWLTVAGIVGLVVGIVCSAISGDLDPIILAVALIAVIVSVVLARSVHNELAAGRELLQRQTADAVATMATVAPAEAAADTQPRDVVYYPGSGLDLLRRDLQRDLSAMLLLHRTIEVTGLVPAPGGWAATPETLLALVAHVVTAPEIHTVVECGSGTSTIWLGLALKQRGSGSLISLEHDLDYAEKTRAAVAAAGLSSVVEVRHAPLEPVTLDGRESSWYSLDATRDLSDVSLLFVDGPPAYVGSLARYPALPVLMDALRPDALVVLDDIDREEEKATLDRWIGPVVALQDWAVKSETDRAVILERRAAPSAATP